MPRSVHVTLTLLAAFITASAHAIPVTTSFTAITSGGGPISGAITWEAASPTAPIEALTSVDLTIAGHTYALEELGFLSPFFESPSGATDLIGATVSGLLQVNEGVDDFWLLFDRSNPAPLQLLYASSTAPGGASSSFASFSITEGRAFAFAPESLTNAVPEPSTLALFAAGLAGLVCGRRRRQSTRAPAGCCDSFIGKHATAHFHNTAHPVMRSLEPGESWDWCYVGQAGFELAEPAPVGRR